MDPKKLDMPLKPQDLKGLKAGERVLLSGIMYTARDAAHMRGIPLDPKGQVIFYAGPTPGKNGKLIGSIGPTTASRMDPFMEDLLGKGLAASIGKGPRSAEVKKLHKKHKAVYFVATGGAAALLARTVKKAEVFEYEDLGPEAVLKLEVFDFPVIVAYDTHGGDVYEQIKN